MRKFLFVLMLSLTALTSLKAQNENKVKESLDFEYYKGKYIFIKTLVNKKDSLLFYFDTGATSSLINKSKADKCGIIPNHSNNVMGAGGDLSYKIARKQRLRFGDIKLKKVDLVIDDLSRLEKKLGHPLDGIVGNSLIKKYITEVNIDKKKINLYKFNAKLDYSGYTVIDFEFKNGIPIPQFEISFSLNNGKTYKGIILFDSGAGLSLLVNSPFDKKHKLSEQIKDKSVVSLDNLSKKSESTILKIKSIKLGGKSIENVEIMVSNDKAGVSALDGYLGILGAEIINKFNYILDYKRMKLYLKPNKSFYKK
ncbi:retroviral aspartyl protease [Marinilabiliaceae bacterium JC040]|nr:retroviral aspartyl protease [Marinilabiliaceae bacterium JC040]